MTAATRSRRMALGVVALNMVLQVVSAAAVSAEGDVIEARKVQDAPLQIFPIPERWSKARAVGIPLRNESPMPYATRVRVAYSDTGLYVAIEVEDTKITSSLDEDLADLWSEDVVGLFLWPNEGLPVTFSYLISPRGRELPLIQAHRDGKSMGAVPWPYEEGKRVQKTWMAIGANGPTQTPTAGAMVEGWGVEVLIPYTLLKPMIDGPPQPGDTWRVNFGRLDYDEGGPAFWSWRPDDGSFDPENFGTLLFK